jgi:hypothetical protein
LKSADGVALHWGVLFSEAREFIWLVPTYVFAIAMAG